LLYNNPYIDEVYTLNTSDLLALSTLRFDVAFCVDKSATAYGVIQQTKVDRLLGFCVDQESGAIVPANSEARELWELGLDNEKKFFENQKAETQLMVEAFDLGPFQRSEYQVFLTEGENSTAASRRHDWGGEELPIVGINTGCSSVIPYKKLSLAGHRELIGKIKSELDVQVVLLGGPEDTGRNEEIASSFNFVHSSPTDKGLRDGLCSVAACDIVISGDSLGMHMAVALKKWVVAWFGPTCSQEIDLYNRGVKIHAEVGCSPCWKRSCDRQPMCYDRVDFAKILSGIQKGVQWLTSSSKQHSSEISY
jgi:heptosyltransferase-2